MGALHEGHLSLVDACRRECDFCVVTIFVNPTQFGPHEDFSRYPRTMEADLRALAQRQVDLVFAPPTEEIYRPGHATYVEMGTVAEPLEGERRPGHFRGVATVVLKLFNLIRPAAAFFGQKDYQQSLVVRRLVEDFDLPIRVQVCPTVRDADGLALSSRNRYLSAAEREHALSLNQSLQLAADLLRGGERDASVLLRRMQDRVQQSRLVRLDYLVVVDPETLQPLAQVSRQALVAVAAWVGSTRLIDNRVLEI